MTGRRSSPNKLSEWASDHYTILVLSSCESPLREANTFSSLQGFYSPFLLWSWYLVDLHRSSYFRQLCFIGLAGSIAACITWPNAPGGGRSSPLPTPYFFLQGSLSIQGSSVLFLLLVSLSPFSFWTLNRGTVFHLICFLIASLKNPILAQSLEQCSWLSAFKPQQTGD